MKTKFTNGGSTEWTKTAPRERWQSTLTPEQVKAFLVPYYQDEAMADVDAITGCRDPALTKSG